MTFQDDKAHHGHLQDLDGIRGILATAVMAYHFGLNSFIARLSGGLFDHVQWGFCVDFFFILSGFVLALSMTKRPPTPRAFFVKRVRRLLPVHLVILCAFLPAFLLHSPPGYLEFLMSVLLLQSSLGMDSVNPPSWSAGLELTVPLIAVVLLNPYMRMSRAIAIALLVLAALAAGVALIGLANGSKQEILRAILGLATGFFLCAVARQWIDPQPGLRRALLTYAALAGAIGVMFLTDIVPAAAALFPVASIFTIIAGSRSRSLLSSPIAQWFGSRSYTIYMVHFPVMIAAIVLFGESQLQGNIAIKAGMIAVSLLLADLLTRFVELPLMRSKPVAAAAAA